MTFLLIFLAALVGGTNTPLVKLNVSIFPPALVAFLRFFIAFLIILPLFFSKKKKFKKPTINLLVINSLFAGNILIFVYAVSKTSIIAAQVLYLLASVFVALFGYLILREKLTRIQIIGLSIAISGLLVLIASAATTNDIKSTGSLVGNLLTFIAVIDWSLYVVFSRKLSRQFSPLEITVYNFGMTALLSLIFLLPALKYNLTFLNNLALADISSVLAMAFLSTVVFFFLYQWIVKHTSAFISTMVNYLATAFAAIAGIIFFHESLTFYLFVGIVLIVFGAYLSAVKNFKLLS